MLRGLLAGLAGLMLSACAYGSAVDMAPMKDRVSRPIVPQGAYCETRPAGGGWQVVSSDDCIPIVWNKTTRTYTMEDDSDPDDIAEAAIVSLGRDLYFAQIADEGPAPFQIQLLLARGEAFAILPVLDDEPLSALAARHPDIIFRKQGKRPYIAAGKARDIKTFLKQAASEGLAEMTRTGEALTIAVRDRAGAPDHSASKDQVKDIDAILKAARRLAPD